MVIERQDPYANHPERIESLRLWEAEQAALRSFFTLANPTKEDILELLEAWRAPQRHSEQHPDPAVPYQRKDEDLFGMGDLDTPAKLSVGVRYFDGLTEGQLYMANKVKTQDPQRWRQQARKHLRNAIAYSQATDVLEAEFTKLTYPA